MKLSRLVTAAAFAALLSSAGYAQTPAETPVAPAPVAAPAAAAAVVATGDLVDTIKASGQFTVLAKALDAANLTAVLKANRNLTLFAPTDAAFAALPAGELDHLMNEDNAAELQSLLVYHLVNAPVDSTKIKGAKGPVKTVAGTELLLDGTGAEMKANSADIVQADVRTSNGILHVVDRVLSPSDPVIAAAKAESAAAAAEAAAAPAV